MCSRPFDGAPVQLICLAGQNKMLCLSSPSLRAVLWVLIEREPLNRTHNLILVRSRRGDAWVRKICAVSAWRPMGVSILRGWPRKESRNIRFGLALSCEEICTLSFGCLGISRCAAVVSAHLANLFPTLRSMACLAITISNVELENLLISKHILYYQKSKPLWETISCYPLNEYLMLSDCYHSDFRPNCFNEMLWRTHYKTDRNSSRANKSVP